MTHFPSEQEIEGYRQMADTLAFDTRYPVQRREPLIRAVHYANNADNPAQMRLQKLLKAIHKFHSKGDAQ